MGYNIASSVRISVSGNTAIISNLENGKWIRVHREVVDVLSGETRDDMMKKCLNAGFSANDSIDFIKELHNYGFINFDLEDVLKNGSVGLLSSAYLNVTDRCNLSCLHCYFGSNNKLSHGVSIKSTFYIVDRLYEAGVRFLTVSGGEAILKPGIDQLFAYLDEKEFTEITLLTNGTAISERTAKIIARYVDHVRVSLDGPNEQINSQVRGAGSFQGAMAGIEKLRDAGAKSIKIITTITSKNLAFMEDIEGIADKLGIQFGTSIFTPVGTGKKNYFLKPSLSGLLEYFRKKAREENFKSSTLEHSLGIDAGITCGCGIHMISVDCRGNIYPCHLFHIPRMKIGNIFKRPNLLEMIEKSMVIRKIRKFTIENRECHGCRVEYFCKGGCLARTVFFNQHFDNPWIKRDPLCRLHKEILSMQLWDKV